MTSYRKKTMSMMFHRSNPTLARQTSYDKIKESFGQGKAAKLVKKLKHEVSYSGLADVPGVALFICDPQEDFMTGGAMPTRKAEETAKKIADILRVHGAGISEVYVTLQQRPRYHVGHPAFWTDRSGQPPEAFVHIDAGDLEKGNYLTARKEHALWSQKYLAQLHKQDIHNIVIFPEHCLVGSKGSTVTSLISSALLTWERKHNKTVHYIPKSGDSRTEQYSAFGALLNMKDNEDTQFNKQLLTRLLSHEKLLLCGFTLSHSVKFTLLDLMNNRKLNEAKLFLLQDCCSSVHDFKNVSTHFIDQLKNVESEFYDKVVVTDSSSVANIIENSMMFDFEEKKNYGSTTRDAGVTSKKFDNIRSDDNFNFAKNELLDGCYLVYDERNYGSLSLVWSKCENLSQETEDVLRNCIAFFKPGTSVKIPDFKYSNNSGLTQIVKELAKGDRRKKFYAGVLRFVSECNRVKGAFVFSSQRLHEDLSEFGVYGLTSDSNIIPVEEERFTDPSEFDVVSCIPKAHNAYRGVTKQSKELFVQTGDNLGATLSLK